MYLGYSRKLNVQIAGHYAYITAPFDAKFNTTLKQTAHAKWLPNLKRWQAKSTYLPQIKQALCQHFGKAAVQPKYMPVTVPVTVTVTRMHTAPTTVVTICGHIICTREQDTFYFGNDVNVIQHNFSYNTGIADVTAPVPVIHGMQIESQLKFTLPIPVTELAYWENHYKVYRTDWFKLDFPSQIPVLSAKKGDSNGTTI